MRARGLKLIKGFINVDKNDVAPHAGAWIETFHIRLAYSLLTVAPHAGAWIETIYSSAKIKTVIVAPHAGAWIETNHSFKKHKQSMSRPMRARGLKRCNHDLA